MSDLGLVESAIEIATDAHKSQLDKAGEPYIHHVLRVAESVWRDWSAGTGWASWNEPSGRQDAYIAALLHDVVEDGHVSAQDIGETFGVTVGEAVDALTRRESDSGKMPRYDYETYIYRVLNNPIACRVKLADLTDNLDRSRIASPTITDYERWGRYEWALAQVKERITWPKGRPF